MRHFIYLITFLLTAVPLLHADDTDEAIYLRIVGDADDAIANLDFKKAEQLLLEAMRLQPGKPTNILLLSNLGMVRFYMGEDSLALETLDTAHRISPTATQVLLNRARVERAMGKLDKAINDYNTITELDSTIVTPYFYRAMILLSYGKTDSAYIEISKLQELEPEGTDTYLAFASYYSAINDPKSAIPYFTRLIDQKKSPEYYSARAICYLKTERLGDAAADIAEGLHLDPLDPELYYCRAILNKKRYQTADAEADARKAVELGLNPERVAGIISK